MRIGKFERKTKETNIRARVNLDGSGTADINLPINFLSHMLTSLSTHSLFDIELRAKGDLEHHVVEDTAICLGNAISKAIGDGSGIQRFGYSIVAMDDSLATAVVDISGRPFAVIELQTTSYTIEGCATEDLKHFLISLASALKANIHIKVKYGENDHHKAEAAFKALALALRQGVSLDSRRIGTPSSKGVL
jgi:imidazoleglycerol-phosphate dehydratase